MYQCQTAHTRERGHFCFCYSFCAGGGASGFFGWVSLNKNDNIGPRKVLVRASLLTCVSQLSRVVPAHVVEAPEDAVVVTDNLGSNQGCQIFLVQHTKTGNSHKISLPHGRKLHMYTKQTRNWPNVHVKCQHVPLQDPPKFTKSGFLVYKYATLGSRLWFAKCFLAKNEQMYVRLLT
jgi:hypothetical protein